MYEFLHSQGHTRPFGDVGSMSGLPESGLKSDISRGPRSAINRLDAPREPPSYHCGNGCSFYVFETGEQIERCSYFFIVS